jgi:hypothetical protein
VLNGTTAHYAPHQQIAWSSLKIRNVNEDEMPAFGKICSSGLTPVYLFLQRARGLAARSETVCSWFLP